MLKLYYTEALELEILRVFVLCKFVVVLLLPVSFSLLIFLTDINP